MIDRLCLLCDFYDEDFECTCTEDYACLLSKDDSISDDIASDNSKPIEKIKPP